VSIVETLKDELRQKCQNAITKDVRIGLGYTAVRFDDDRTGVAFTFRDRNSGCCSSFFRDRPLAGQPAKELLKMLGAVDLVGSAIGLATANAAANKDYLKTDAGDILDVLDLKPTDRVGMVGFFAPLIYSLERRVKSIDIFEERLDFSENLRPASDAVKAMSSFNVAIFSSTTIINKTIDELLSSAKGCREVVLLGSSTPMSPETFVSTPVTWLSGITVNDSDGILRLVSEAGGTRFFKPYVTKWNLRLNKQ
jgi:uncharacterized protein